MGQATGTLSRQTVFAGDRTFSGNITVNNNLYLPDNNYIYFGTGNDGYIYSNGTNAYASLYDLNLTGTLTATGLITANAGIKTDENFTFDGAVTTSNKGIGLVWTGWDKETTADFSDNAYIKHTTNLGGITGSVLLLGSLNDATDGIAFITHADSDLMHNGNIIYDAGNFVSGTDYAPAHSHPYMSTSHPANAHTATHLYMSNGDGIVWNDTSNVMSVRKDSTDYELWDSGNLTNLNQLTNGPGYISSYTNTLNSAGSTNSDSKLFLVGATSQASSATTYSDSEVYTTNGTITTNKVQVGNGSATMEYNATTESLDFIFA